MLLIGLIGLSLDTGIRRLERLKSVGWGFRHEWHRLTNATAEGLNSKIQMVKEMACGFGNREHYKTAIYFHCGGLDLYPRVEASA